MFVNLEEINSNIKEELIVEEEVKIEDTFLNDTSIKKLDNVKLKAVIFRNSADETILSGTLSGNMHLEDSISLDDIVYPFSIELEEILENEANTIDILPILYLQYQFWEERNDFGIHELRVLWQNQIFRQNHHRQIHV